jgi:hypothetical protein
MPDRRSAHRTQWAAQFAVASELCKRDYRVALTMGNHPIVDLMVSSPTGRLFSIDVKGLYKKNFWGVRKREKTPGLFYIFAFVPDNEPNQFYILTQNQVNDEIEKEFERSRLRAKAKNKNGEKAELFPGVGWKFVSDYPDKWDVLPK